MDNKRERGEGRPTMADFRSSNGYNYHMALGLEHFLKDWIEDRRLGKKGTNEKAANDQAVAVLREIQKTETYEGMQAIAARLSQEGFESPNEIQIEAQAYILSLEPNIDVD